MTRIAFRLNPAIAPIFRDYISPGSATLPGPIEDIADQRALDAIPSETTPPERRFLYHYFATVWSGVGSVLEIGPFLGGTTRAIAMGMLANPRRSAAARVYSFDRFRDYYRPDELLAFLEPLVTSEALALRPEWRATGGSFREVFNRVHADQSYTSLIVGGEALLPDLPGELAAGGNLFRWIPEVEFDAVFDDGCKSRFSTKYLLREAALGGIEPGAYFIFQDYGWYTCFWIPSIVQLLKSCFRLVAYVDSTYVFEYPQYRDIIKKALVSPTYYPTTGGQQAVRL